MVSLLDLYSVVDVCRERIDYCDAVDTLVVIRDEGERVSFGILRTDNEHESEEFCNG